MPQLLDDSILGQQEKFLIYGHPKVGKSYLSGTLPSPVYHLVIGPPNELKCLRSPDFRSIYPDSVHYFDFALEEYGKRGIFVEANAFDVACDLMDAALDLDRMTPDEHKHILQMIEKNAKNIEIRKEMNLEQATIDSIKDKGSTPFHFESIVIDNVTTLMEVQMNKAIEVGDIRAKDKSKSLELLRKENIMIPADNDYMSAMALMDNFVNWFFKIPKHGCMIAHVHEVMKQDRSGHSEILQKQRPLFYGKQRTRIPRAFDNVWYCDITGGNLFETLTVGDNITIAGTRTGGVIKDKLRDANLEECIKLLTAGKARRGKKAKEDK